MIKIIKVSERLLELQKYSYAHNHQIIEICQGGLLVFSEDRYGTVRSWPRRQTGVSLNAH